VLATGSYPFVPPIRARTDPGVHVYRTIEDLDDIIADARGSERGVVIGGGLLGLEAAEALQHLGLATTVVEFAPAADARPARRGGAAALRAVSRSWASRCGPATPPRRSSATTPGIWSGWTSGTTGRWPPTSWCSRPASGHATSWLATPAWRSPSGAASSSTDLPHRDEHVWAIGECAAVEGTCYGLVGPGTRWHASSPTGSRVEGRFPGADLSTKLKLLGVDVASFGDAQAATPGAHAVVFDDAAEAVYKKLVVDDEGRLLGGILVGDADDYPCCTSSTSAASRWSPPREPGRPRRLRRWGGGAGTGGAAGQLHGLHLQQRHQGRAARAVVAPRSTARVHHHPGRPQGRHQRRHRLRQLLDAVQGRCWTTSSSPPASRSTTACASTSPTPARSCSTSCTPTVCAPSPSCSTAGAAGSGCAVCKPAVASMLASLYAEHILDDEHAPLQDTNDRYLANMQRDGTYSVVPRVPGGEITPRQLIVLGEIAEDYDLYTKITGGQRVDLFGARLDQLPVIWGRLNAAGFESGHAYGKALRTVKSCVGTSWCRYGVQDSTSLAIQLELRYRGCAHPHKIKSAVSGCSRECAEAQSKDVGVIATENGWNLYVCGNGGMRRGTRTVRRGPRHRRR
jgi:nitrite reductase (NADH) large subunit